MIRINPIYIVLAASLGACIILWQLWRRDHREMVRSQQNQSTLLSEVQYWKLKDSSNAASIGTMSLTVQELKEASDSQLMTLKATIEKLDLRIRQVKNASSVNFESVNQVNTFLRDSIILDTVPIKVFSRSTKFNDIQLTVWPTREDSLELRVITRDRMTQVVYKVPRGLKFWEKDWWRKRKLRQVVHFENPDTRISYPQYIEIKRNNK